MQPETPEFRITSLEEGPAPEQLEPLLVDYWSVIAAKLRDLGGPDLSVVDLVQDNLANLGDYLPPKGRVFLAYSPDQKLLGCGFLGQITPDAGEMKRLFVRPQAQGSGLGRALVESRIEAARQMGLSWLYADTLKGNTSMLRLYDKLGFQEVPRYPSHKNYDAVMPHIVYRGLKL